MSELLDEAVALVKRGVDAALSPHQILHELTLYRNAHRDAAVVETEPVWEPEPGAAAGAVAAPDPVHEEPSAETEQPSGNPDEEPEPAAKPKRQASKTNRAAKQP